MKLLEKIERYLTARKRYERAQVVNDPFIHEPTLEEFGITKPDEKRLAETLVDRMKGRSRI